MPNVISLSSAKRPSGNSPSIPSNGAIQPSTFNTIVRQTSAQILVVASQKDGVGKTTTTINLATPLASKGRRVPVTGLNPQDNAATDNGINRVAIGSGVYQVVPGEAGIPNAVARSKEGGYGILGANRTLAGVEAELVQEITCEIRLKNAPQLVADNYDYVLIDCLPSLTLLALNGLVVTNGVIVPMLCECYALEGISDLVTTVREICQAINPDLDVTGIVHTMYDSRSRLVVEVSEQFKQCFGSLLFDTITPRSIRFVEAPSHGLPVSAYDARAKSTQAYLDLADELIAWSEE